MKSRISLLCTELTSDSIHLVLGTILWWYLSQYCKGPLLVPNSIPLQFGYRLSEAAYCWLPP